MRLITASQLERVRACPASASLPAAFEPESKHAVRGTAIHAYFENYKHGKEVALSKVAPEFREECAAIDMRGLDLASYSAEQGFALLLTMGATPRQLPSTHDRAVRYAECRSEDDIAGCADLLGLTDDSVVALDIKTGWGWLPDPSKSLQLGFFAVAAARFYDKRKARVGWIIARDDKPYVVTEELDALALSEIEDELRDIHRRALEASKQTNPDVTIGAHCKYCPALRRCPAHTGVMPVEQQLITPDAATLDYIEALERRAKMARDSIKMLASQEPIKLSNDLVYGPRVMTRTNKATGEVTEFEKFEAYKP